jgi:hypothetical protein
MSSLRRSQAFVHTRHGYLKAVNDAYSAWLTALMSFAISNQSVSPTSGDIRGPRESLPRRRSKDRLLTPYLGRVLAPHQACGKC